MKKVSKLLVAALAVVLVLRSVVGTCPDPASRNAAVVPLVLPSGSHSTDARAVAAGDIDGDGVDDLVTAGSVMLGLFRGQAGAGLGVHAFANISGVTTPITDGLALADLNHDSALDIVVALTANQFRVFLSTGPGAIFAAADVYVTAATINALAVGDVDGDGAIDVALATAGALRWLRNVGNGTLEAVTPVVAAANTNDVALVDLDADGSTDMVTVNPGASSPVVWHRNSNAAGTVWTTQSFGSFISPAHVVVTDVDGDAVLDLVVGSSVAIHWLRGLGVATFAPDVSLVGGTFADPFLVGKFGGAGPSDVLALEGSSLLLLASNETLGFATMTLAKRSLFASFDNAKSLAAGDYDGDGMTDVAAACSNSHSFVWFSSSSERALSTPLFDAAVVKPHPRSALEVVDIDGDGWNDIAGTVPITEVLSYRACFGSGTCTADMSPLQSNVIGYTPKLLDLADVNGDGVPDAVVGKYLGTDPVMYLVSKSDSTQYVGWRVLATPVGNAAPVEITFVDMDGDGFRDILLGYRGSTSGVALYPNTDGAGSFSTVTPIDLLSKTSNIDALGVGDVNADGIPDVVVTYPEHIKVFTNNYTHLTEFATVSTSPPPPPLEAVAVVIVDLELDGAPDIVCAGNAGGRAVFWASQTAVGVFRDLELIVLPADPPCPSPPCPWQFSKLYATDLNLDSVPDLVASGSYGTLIMVNTRIISQEQWYFEALPRDKAVAAVGDINGDGFPDVVVSNDIATHFHHFAPSSVWVRSLPTSYRPNDLDHLAECGVSAAGKRSLRCFAARVERGRRCGVPVVLPPSDYGASCLSVYLVVQARSGVDVVVNATGSVVDCAGDASSVLFKVPSGVHLTLHGLSLANVVGSHDGESAVWVSGTNAQLVFDGGQVTGCGETGLVGGAFRVDSGGALALSRVTATGNHATFGGLVAATGTGTELVVENCILSDHTAMVRGGAVYAANRASARIVATASTSSRAAVSGGFVALDDASVELNQVSVIDSQAGIRGGSLSAEYTLAVGGAVIATDVSFVESHVSVGNGGAVAVAIADASVPSVTLTRVTMERCTAGGGGGGLALTGRDSTLLLVDVTVRDTSAQYGGGLLCLADGAVLPEVASVVRIALGDGSPAHRVTTSGGGLSIERGHAVIGGGIYECMCDIQPGVQVTLSETHADGAGGGGFTCAASQSLFSPDSPNVVSSVPGTGFGPVWATPPVRITWPLPPPDSVGSALPLLATAAAMVDGYGQRIKQVNTTTTFSLVGFPRLAAGTVEYIGPSIIPLSNDGLFVFASVSFGVYGPPYVDLATEIELSIVGSVNPELGTASRVPIKLTLCPPGNGGVQPAISPWLVCVPCSGTDTSNETSVEPCVRRSPCPETTLAVQSNSTVACVCKAGFFPPPGRTDSDPCTVCPDGAECPLGTTFPLPLPGFFPVGDGTFVQCKRPSACPGGALAAPCAPGYEGYMCNTCSAGFYSDSAGLCKSCPSNSSVVLALALIGLALVALGSAVVVGWVVVGAGKASGLASGEIKSQAELIRKFRRLSWPASCSMVLISFQIIGIVVDVDLRWSSSSRAVLSSFNVFNVDANVFASECALASFHTKYAVSVLLVPVFLLLAFASLAATARILPPLGVLQGLEALSIGALADALIFNYAPLLYIPMARATLVVFDCTRLPSGDYVLDADPGVACFDSKWWQVVWIGMLGTGGYVVGVPLYFGWKLGRHRHELFSPAVSQRLGGLYRLYRRKMYGYGVMDLGKRLALVVIALFFSSSQLLLIAMLMAVLTGALLVVVTQEPYYIPMYNALEAKLTLVLMCVVLIGAGSYAERSSASLDTAFLVVTVLAVLVLVCVAVAGVVADIRLILRDRRQGARSTASDRQRRLMAIITDELRDVEAGPELLRDAGQFLARC
ncbi:uncharacterized protein AMSG_06199 [Thecamonas trahens ATCC 50062]|uniref:Tyrosine-protein kinase ephrin type A/B receptor-like domain-containing protein n=1 Tax=Thecamonas trahens ATCC 50062 TaxID=461836 RepID=A0A0L0DC26_THETB|nr:hypothetical protein AMSG_06199 [Thecamonas trahens ATCC 50062]KNC49899.1 hypothetical protein AMSG_06199 [Thecamonas trahens ATCC 50062]|eukprot:XP_013757380.1 hypothetical protein AMSG_06199 [Thecamonas trahens ATCC 50062]